MAQKNQLRHLVDLIDDEEFEVRNQVMNAFSEYGMNLEADLKEFSHIIDSQKLEIIKPIIEENRREWFKNNWMSWLALETEIERLETASDLIARFQLGNDYHLNLPRLFDQISEDFKNRYPYGNELDLSTFLFHVLDIRGAKDDYYNPLNSNLIYVIENGRGLPITLTIIFMILADRVGLFVEGCNLPGHYMAKIKIDGELLLIDCFNNGRIIFENEIRSLSNDSYDMVLNIINSKASTSSIIKRVLNNLVNSYQAKGDHSNKKFFTEVIKSTPW